MSADNESQLYINDVMGEIINDISSEFVQNCKEDIKQDIKENVKKFLVDDIKANVGIFDASKTATNQNQEKIEEVNEAIAINAAKPKTIKAPAIIGGIFAIAAIIYIMVIVFVFNGWKEIDAGYKYYEYGKIATGYRTIEGIDYIFDENNELKEGWIDYNNLRYYQDFANGVYKNESLVNGVKYNFAADGSLVVGTVKKGNDTYLYDQQGYSVTGLAMIDGDCYFANKDGLVVFGWQHLDGNTYYFDETTGIRTVSEANIDNKDWYFDEEGVLKRGIVELPEGKRYYLTNGGFATGLYSVKDKTYLFDENGYMQTGFITLDDKEYYFQDNDGTMYRGWMQQGDEFYYYFADGSKAYGFVNIDGGKHYFESSKGVMLTGWQDIDDSRYYFDNAGVMVSGATNISGSLYYFDGSGRLSSGEGWFVNNAKKYYKLGDGKIATGFKDIDGKTYYFASNGVMSIGMTKVAGNMYYFYNDGSMARNTKIGKFNVDAEGVLTNPFAVITPDNLDAYIQVLLDTYGRDTLSIFKYCRNNFWYKYRDKADITTMACRMINNGSGACWDYAALCYKMLKAAGYNCQIVIGKGAYYSEHNWILIEVSPGVWRHMDPERQGLWVYMLTDAELDALDGCSRGVRYQWNHSAYPNAK